MGEIVTRCARRFDRSLAPLGADEPFEKTPEGFLKGRAILTSTGVFPYRDATGGVRRELRLPEDVFHPDHLESLKLKPITLEHPSEEVTPENAAQYAVGHMGSNPLTTDNHHLSCDAIITHGDAIKAIEGGKRSLSCGYTCDLERADMDASHEGMPYDYIQRNIRANHVAIVDKARAGDAPRIRLDSADAVMIEEAETTTMNINTIHLGMPRFDTAMMGGVSKITSKPLDSELYRRDMIRRLGCRARGEPEPDVAYLRARADAAGAELPAPVLGSCDADRYREAMIARMHADSRGPCGARLDNKSEWFDGLSQALRQG